jgi:hypothetical protein
MAAELGIPGVCFLMAFYLLCLWRLLPAALGRRGSPEWLRPYAQMVVASIPCFMLEQCFGTFIGMEIPYYVAMLGAGGLKLAARQTTTVTSAYKASMPVPSSVSLPRRWESLRPVV